MFNVCFGEEKRCTARIILKRISFRLTSNYEKLKKNFHLEGRLFEIDVCVYVCLSVVSAVAAVNTVAMVI